MYTRQCLAWVDNYVAYQTHSLILRHTNKANVEIPIVAKASYSYIHPYYQ